MTVPYRVGLLLASLMLSACASVFEERDSGPDEPVDLSHVPDAEPRQEPRTRAGNKNPYTVLGKTYHLLEDETGYRERGTASWYGRKFHGRHTSNGEVYDMFAMTAAHKTLPIPSYVRVTNLNNGREVVVRVNDRGPFHGQRLIDLSYAAAQRLGFADQGTAPVEVVIVAPEESPSTSAHEEADQKGERPADADPVRAEENTFLQVGAFSSREAARRQQRQLSEWLDRPVVIHSDEDPTLHRVRIGPLTRDGEVRELREQLRSKAIEQTHIVRQ